MPVHEGQVRGFQKPRPSCQNAVSCVLVALFYQKIVLFFDYALIETRMGEGNGKGWVQLLMINELGINVNKRRGGLTLQKSEN